MNLVTSIRSHLAKGPAIELNQFNSMDELLDVMKAGLSLGVLHSVAHDVLADKKKE